MSLAVAELPLVTRRAGGLERALNIAAILAAVVLVVRFFLLINRMAVDVLFWDQLGYYTAIWNRESVWHLFIRQHGPHRMGLGFPIMHVIDNLTGWNQRAQAFVVGITMCLAAGAALWLKRRLTGSLAWYDIAIPMLFLTNRQWALYADVINLSHGALPLFLIVLIAFAWTLKSPYVSYLGIAILTFLATFTGFGFFAGIVVPAVCLVRLVVLLRVGWRERKHEIIAAALCIALCGVTLAVFFHKWVMNPAAPGFVFPHPRPMEYLYFMGLELAYMLGARMPGLGKEPGTGNIFYGMVLLAMFSAGAAYVLWRSLRKQSADDRLWHVLLFLVLFTAAFLANSAVGRVCTGLFNAMTSRYTPLLMPGLFAMFLLAVTAARPTLRFAAIGLLLVLLTFGTFATTGWMSLYYVDGKHAWIAAYKETHSIYLSDVKSNFQIFPDSVRQPIKQRLDWLEQRKLSLFRE